MKRSKQHLMKRTARVYLNDLNQGKAVRIQNFIYFCHDVMQYYVDLFWQRQDFTGKLADLPTVHRAKQRFQTTTRLCQALAKQAKEIVRSQHKKERKCKPRLRYHTVTLFYHFVTIERFNQTGFDWAVKLIGSGAPRLVIPIPSTKLINQRIADGWQMSKTIRMGIRGDGRLWIDFIFEKERPKLKDEGKIVGMDSNYKNGLVFSDGQSFGDPIYTRIQKFAKRQKHTKNDSIVAGDLTIQADSIFLSNVGEIRATTLSGDGGNITLLANDLLFLQQESQISTTAGTAGARGDGGNIKIDAPFIIALPNENSDVTANTLEIEPSRQLFFLPTQPLNAQIDQSCTPGTKFARSELVFIGKGGIAPNNLEALQINPNKPDWVEFPQGEDLSQPTLPNINESQSDRIVEAQGWIKDENGEIILVTDTSTVTPHDSWQKLKQCDRASKSQ